MQETEPMTTHCSSHRLYSPTILIPGVVNTPLTLYLPQMGGQGPSKSTLHGRVCTDSGPRAKDDESKEVTRRKRHATEADVDDVVVELSSIAGSTGLLTSEGYETTARPRDNGKISQRRQYTTNDAEGAGVCG